MNEHPQKAKKRFSLDYLVFLTVGRDILFS